jgi:hypothetical protein
VLEYVFFDKGLREKFVRYAAEKEVAAEVSDEGGILAMVSEDIDDEIFDELDHYYEILLQENAEMLEGTEDALEKSAAGVQVELSDGTACNIKFDPDVIARLLNCISMEELRDLVQAIAVRVENPDDRPICQL